MWKFLKRKTEMNINRLFGTDGIRGVANHYPIEPLTLVKVGKALVSLLQTELNHNKTIKVVIGRDTRISGPMIESALSSGISSQGGRVWLAGEIPTPAIAYITRAMRADAGIVISASHNPYHDNGVKIFSAEGYKIPDEWERRIERLIQSEEFNHAPTGEDVGQAEYIVGAQARYIEFLKNTFPKNYTLKGLKIVLDCANGAAYKVAPTVLEELDADVIVSYNEPNGKNINDQCGATTPTELKKRVLEEKADIGLALDGDADRLIVVDERGNVRDGDDIMALCALELLSKDKLQKRTVVTTQMSNFGFERFLKEQKIAMVRTDVGDRYVVEEMRRHGYNFGGEQCGHLVFLDFNTTGDGLVSALQLLSIMVEKNKPLSELCQTFKRSPQVLYNVRVREKKSLESIPHISRKMKEVHTELEGKGRLLIRYSGTENLCRVMIEGDDQDQIQKMAMELVEVIKSELGE